MHGKFWVRWQQFHVITAFEEQDMHRFQIFFGTTYPFLSLLYKFYLSLKDLEI